MSGVLQAVFQNFAPRAPTVIGQAFGGGFYAGQIGVSSVATHYLIVGPVASAQSTLQWKNVSTNTPGADSDIDGPQNTADMVADGNDGCPYMEFYFRSSFFGRRQNKHDEVSFNCIMAGDWSLPSTFGYFLFS